VLLKRLQERFQQRFPDTAASNGGLWRRDLVDGVGKNIDQPPTFDEFVRLPQWTAFGELTPRQDAFLRRAFSFDPNTVFDASKRVTTAVALWGKGSGKDMLSSLFIAWVAFVVNSLRDPWEYLGMAPGEPIDIANIATTANQAETVYFKKLQARIKRRCFGQFAPRVGQNIITFYRKPPGYTTPIVLLQMHSLHSENESWEGKSLLAWVMDEADAFHDREGRNMAQSCYATLLTSAGSRFGSRWVGIVISFRRVRDGFMDKLFQDAQTSSNMVCDSATTFEVLPWRSKSDPDIAEAYKNLPELAPAMYENLAPSALDAFFKMERCITACVDVKRKSIADVEEIVTERVITNTGQRQEFIGLKLTNIQGDKDKTYFVHGDPGESDASFAVCLCHVEAQKGITRGKDTVADDDYAGDVLVGDTGRPIENAEVVYFNPGGDEVDSCFTDDEGKHLIWLPSGDYSYALYDKHGEVRAEEGIHIEVGVEMSVSTGEEDITGQPIFETQIVYPVIEDLLLEWRPRGNMPVDFENVRQVLGQLANLFNIYMMTFDRWNSVMIIQSLQSDGINAQDLAFTNPQQLAMYLNLRQLTYTGMVSYLDNDRANYQLRRLRCKNGVKIVPSENEWKDLADARAASMYYATKFGAFESGFDGFAMNEEIDPEMKAWMQSQETVPL